MEKCQFCGVLKQMFSSFRKVCFVYETLKIVFSQLIFATYDMGIQGVTSGFKGLQGGYKRLQRVTEGDKG